MKKLVLIKNLPQVVIKPHHIASIYNIHTYVEPTELKLYYEKNYNVSILKENSE